MGELDLDGPSPSVTITATLSRVAGQGLVAGATKTTGSEGSIPLVEPALRAMREHSKRQKAERLAAPVWGDREMVFASPIGTWTDPRNALRSCQWVDAASWPGKRRMHAPATPAPP